MSSTNITDLCIKKNSIRRWRWWCTSNSDSWNINFKRTSTSKYCSVRWKEFIEWKKYSCRFFSKTSWCYSYGCSSLFNIRIFSNGFEEIFRLLRWKWRNGCYINSSKNKRIDESMNTYGFCRVICIKWLMHYSFVIVVELFIVI